MFCSRSGSVTIKSGAEEPSPVMFCSRSWTEKPTEKSKSDRERKVVLRLSSFHLLKLVLNDSDMKRVRNGATVKSAGRRNRAVHLRVIDFWCEVTTGKWIWFKMTNNYAVFFIDVIERIWLAVLTAGITRHGDTTDHRRDVDPSHHTANWDVWFGPRLHFTFPSSAFRRNPKSGLQIHYSTIFPTIEG